MPVRVVRRAPKRKMFKRKQTVRSSGVKVSPVVKTYVKRMINQSQEDKICTPASQATAAIAPMSTTAFNAITLNQVWVLSQGTGQGNRVGNHITPKSWRIKGYWSCPFDTQAAQPFIIKMYIFKLKSGFQTPVGNTNFYQNGNTSIAPALNFSDQLKDVNKNLFTVYYERVFKVGSANIAATLGSANNDFKNICPFNINLLKYQKSPLHYNDTTSSASNSGLYMCYTACFADGSTYTSAANGPDLTYEISASFEDA